MRAQIRCVHCSCFFFPDPRVKDQRYCSKRDCQLARKRLRQKEKLARDPDSILNQRDSNEQWRSNHPDYWMNYRLGHPEYTHRNRELQKGRDRGRIELVKMDASELQPLVKQGIYNLIP